MKTRRRIVIEVELPANAAHITQWHTALIPQLRTILPNMVRCDTEELRDKEPARP